MAGESPGIAAGGSHARRWFFPGHDAAAPALCTYQFTKRVSFFANGRNIANVPFNQLRYGPETPDYARRSSTIAYGVQWAFGVKGTF